MTEDEWERRADRFSERPVRSTIRGIGAVWVVVIVVIVLGGVTSAVLWATGVWASDIKGQGDAEKIKNSAPNRIEAQEQFEELFADIKVADKNVQLAADALAKDPTSSKLLTEYTGMKQYCNDLVGDYNADARKFSKEQFRAADLPAEIDDTDRETDCKEDAP